MNTASSEIIALLGPTNTGKTHVAIEKMLEFKSGIFGLPLRLLAREVYDKCVNKVGNDKVALITGEEKIIPSTADYFICTVESMPKDKQVDFVAINTVDETEIYLTSSTDASGTIAIDDSDIPKGTYKTSKTQ